MNGKLLGKVNATLISLVPKVPNPNRVSEFRPIACYNVIYKCIVVLEQFGFPEKMVKWIMVCVSTTKFSININEEREGYFNVGRGLRQGDPMSPNLFTLVMEDFNLILRRYINDTKEFKYHQRCQKLGITHLCFADDLLVFCHGDHKSVNVIKKALEEFSSYSGLKANMSKSTVFFGGLTNA
ncbi:RNA-directed DNA polymerase, eukaryota, reverse transcriptase zinc-binding domain protein [Tanacetum coccineum]